MNAAPARNTTAAPDARLAAVYSVICIALVAGIAFSPRLWLSLRSFPFAPPLPFIAPLPYPFDGALLAAFVILLAAAALLAKRSLLPALLAVAAALAVQDQTRWQPWFFQYIAMLVAITFLAARDSGRALDACRAIVAGTYFWSGLQKLNAAFLDKGLAPMVDTTAVSAAFHTALVYVGPLVPPLEVGIGLGLLWPRSRTQAAWAALLLHAGILMLIGPFGHGWNSVVWPWNLAMMGFAVLLFQGGEASGARRILALSAPRSVVHVAVVVTFWLLPALNWIGAWDAYLSAALYSQNIRQGALKISPQAAERMPEDLRRRIDADSLIWLLDWSLDDMNVPVYPEARVFRTVTRSLCGYAREPEDIYLLITSQADVFTGERDVVTTTCGGLD